MTPALSERARELGEWLIEQVLELDEGIAEYSAGCPAWHRAIAKREVLQSRAETLESLLAENEKLRAALTSCDSAVAQYAEDYRSGPIGLGAYHACLKVQNIARAAMNGEPAEWKDSVPGQDEPEGGI